MPWNIEHKCNITDSESTPFTIIKSEHNGAPITVVACPKPGGCRERFVVIGHEFFGEAESAERFGSSFPPGFVIARTVTD